MIAPMNRAPFDRRSFFKTSCATSLALFDIRRLAFSSAVASSTDSYVCQTPALARHRAPNLVQPCRYGNRWLAVALEGSADLIRAEVWGWIRLIARQVAVLSNGDLYGSVCNE